MGFHKIFPSPKTSRPPQKKCSPSSTCGSYQCNHLDQSSRFEASVMYQTSPPAPGRCLRLKTKTWRNDGKSHGIFHGKSKVMAKLSFYIIICYMFFIWILLNEGTTKKGGWLNMLDKYRRTSWKNDQNVQQTSVEKASKDPKVLKNMHKTGMVARKESGNIYSCKKMMGASRNMYGKMLTKNA